MDLNDTKSTSNSTTSHVKQVFYCPEVPNFTWDLDDTTFAWSLLVIRCIAGPCIIFANILVIIIMKTKKVLQKQSTILLSSMAVTDLLAGAVSTPLSVSTDVLILRQISFAHICTLDSLSICFSDFLGICSLYHLTVIAWERYVAIRKWMDYKVIITASRVRKLAIAGWLSTIFITVPVLVIRPAGVEYNVVEGWYIGQGVLGGVLLFLLVYFYIMVYLGVRKRQINQISQVTALVKAKMESKVAKTTGLLTTVVIFSYVPMGVFMILGDFLPVLRSNSGFRSVELIVQLNSLTNPLLYSYRDRRFRNAVLELVGMRKPKTIQPVVSAMRYVKRKVPKGSQEDVIDIEKAKKRIRLFRSESACDPVTVLDCVHRNNELMLKRSISAPMLCNSCFDDQLLQEQTSSILTTTAIIHVQSGARDKARTIHRDLPKDVKTELQGTSHLSCNLSRSKSWDASAIVEFADRCCSNLQDRTVRRSESAPWLSTNVIVPDETTSTDSGFTTRF